MKKWSIALLIVISGITLYGIYQAVVTFYVLIPWAVPWIGDIVVQNPEKPEIAHAEFPFQLIYELDGDVKVIEDAVICDFDGFELRGAAGKYRKWKSRLKSGNERVTLLKPDENIELYFSHGSPEFYMNDPSGIGYEFSYDKFLPCIKRKNGVQIADTIITRTEVWEKYKLKIISWKYTPPIKNKFE